MKVRQKWEKFSNCNKQMKRAILNFNERVSSRSKARLLRSEILGLHHEVTGEVEEEGVQQQQLQQHNKGLK